LFFPLSSYFLFWNSSYRWLSQLSYLRKRFSFTPTCWTQITFYKSSTR